MDKPAPYVIRTVSGNRIEGGGVYVRLDHVGALVEAAGAWLDSRYKEAPQAEAEARLVKVINAMQTLGIMYRAGEGD